MSYLLKIFPILYVNTYGTVITIQITRMDLRLILLRRLTPEVISGFRIRIRIQSGQWIRIRIQNPDYLSRAEGFFCNLNVPHRGLGIYKMQFFD